jgi:cell division protein FtsB
MLKIESISRRLFLVAGIGLLILIVFSFSKRIGEYTRLNAQEGIEGARITELVATQSFLSEQIAYATSEASVEEWARQDARMAKDGDFTVVPINPDGSLFDTNSPLEGAEKDLSNFQVWLEWFFYQGP